MMTSLKESKLQTLSLAVISHYWDGGYTEDFLYRKDEFQVPQEIWANILKYGIPSGSDWDNYIGYNFIRIFPIKHSNKTYIVLSTTKVSQGDYATTPSSYIYLFLLQDFQEICKQELSWFLKEIYLLLGISCYDFTKIASFYSKTKQSLNHKSQQNSCFKLIGFKSTFPEQRMFFEIFFISQFFYHFCNQKKKNNNLEEILSISSLCTPQDNIDKFNIFGMFQDNSIKNSKHKVLKLSISSDEIKIEKDYMFISILQEWSKKKLSLSLFLCLILASTLSGSGYMIGFNVAQPSINQNVEKTLIFKLVDWNYQTKQGIVFSLPTNSCLPNHNNTSIDIAWVNWERWQKFKEQPQEFMSICPDFIIKVRSERDQLQPLQEQMQKYVDNGVRLSWLIDSQNQQIEIYRQGKTVQTVKYPTKLSGAEILPGFTVNLP